jgi:glycosyltransferase involved in cell wall biosynthesis
MVSKALVSAAYRKRVEEIAALGVDMSLVVPSRWGEWPLEQGAPRGYRMDVLHAFLNGRNHFHFYSGLRRVFERERPDIAHIDEEPYSIVTWQAMREARRVGARIIFYTWQNILKRFPPPFNWIERRAFRDAALGLAGNEEAAQVLASKGFRSPVRIVPQMGVDPEAYSPGDSADYRKELGLDGRFVIGYLGRLLPEKGVTTLLEAVETVAGRGARAALFLRGSGPMLKGVRKHIAAVPALRDATVILPPVESHRVPGVLRAMDCLVLPSLTRPNWKEQFGRVLVEAMSCGVPVIGSDSGEIPNVVGDAGLIFPEGAASALAARIETLIHDAPLRRELARRGRERVLEKYTHRKVAEQTVAAYEEALHVG